MDKKLVGYAGFDKLNDDVMSNFDHEINKDIEVRLKNEKVYSGYPGWNFHGEVWYEQNQFHCEVWVYGSIKEVISEDTLEELMESVSDKYGCE